jgi:hypothetical protein
VKIIIVAANTDAARKIPGTLEPPFMVRMDQKRKSFIAWSPLLKKDLLSSVIPAGQTGLVLRRKVT